MCLLTTDDLCELFRSSPQTAPSLVVTVLQFTDFTMCITRCTLQFQGGKDYSILEMRTRAVQN